MPRHRPGTSAAPWALAVLAALGTSSNGDNALALDLWAQSEGAPDWRHNWLNTTLPGYGGHVGELRRGQARTRRSPPG
jgi:hypothetical protein